jgi:hypothetical protein
VESRRPSTLPLPPSRQALIQSHEKKKMGQAEVVFGRDCEQAACLKTAYFGGEWGGERGGGGWVWVSRRGADC